jgi:hypothetical protein
MYNLSFHTAKNKKLVENYDKRIQKFVLEMASHPRRIKDYMNPVESTRAELMKENDPKIQGRKGFIFKGFITEKERIVTKILFINRKTIWRKEKNAMMIPNMTKKTERTVNPFTHIFSRKCGLNLAQT